MSPLALPCPAPNWWQISVLKGRVTPASPYAPSLPLHQKPSLSWVQGRLDFRTVSSTLCHLICTTMHKAGNSRKTEAPRWSVTCLWSHKKRKKKIMALSSLYFPWEEPKHVTVSSTSGLRSAYIGLCVSCSITSDSLRTIAHQGPPSMELSRQ